jgi:putative SOS response-associated peptidase YedK
VCGRYASSRPPDLLADELEAEVDCAVIPPSWNVAPTMPVYAVLSRHGRRVVRALRWGLVPSWASDLSIGSRLINARAETLTDKPAFRAALAARRCVLPADGYYEWRLTPNGKQPYFLHAGAGAPGAVGAGGGLTFAGLYEIWRDPRHADAPLIWSATIITTAATPDLSHLHDRMPVVLDRAGVDDWLAPGPPSPHLLRGAAPGALTAHPVGPRVSDVRQDGPDLVAPAPELAARLSESAESTLF